mmetsp:Transcript_8242/g.14345  ORF Transcript_8242/g.14345 Transcript_8242/m.14345 type:complete len:431 (+) Transcript_8242:75-1367(+)
MTRIRNPTTPLFAAAFLAGSIVPSTSFSPAIISRNSVNIPSSSQFQATTGSSSSSRSGSSSALRMSTLPPGIQNQPTELPDSLEDAASIAANSCHQLSVTAGTTVRCRVDFDTSIGDETYTTLKSTTEFMQQFVSSLCLASIKGVMEWKQDGVMRLIQAKSELREVREQLQELGLSTSDDDDEDDVDFGAYPGDESDEGDVTNENESSEEAIKLSEREAELLQLIANEGIDPTAEWTGQKVRIYFPDEGSAALARRDWSSRVPPCVEFASCGGVQVADGSNDAIIIFYCPRASEAEFVEEILYKTEENRGEGLLMSIMVNPLLVDMGVTGFGMAGRRLRERLIDGLVPAYYLRTLAWGALTRVWPQLFTVWQEDEEAEGGYRMIKAMDRLPSNPEVEDIYDIENGNMNAPQEGMGLLNALGDFVNGMTKL